MLMQTARTVLPAARLASPAQPAARSFRDADRGFPRLGDEAVDLKIGQLLCSRLCHDLIGPAAAINAGEELIRESDDGDGGDARELIAESARQLAGRLTFFRIAFGQGGTLSGGLSYAQARELAEGFLCGGRVRLEWMPNEADLFGDAVLPGDSVRLLLCLIMLASDALPRGGSVRVRVDAGATHVRLALIAEGRVARLSAEVLDALNANEAASITPRTVHAFYLSCLAERLQASIEVDAEAGGAAMHLQAMVPANFRFIERRRA